MLCSMRDRKMGVCRTKFVEQSPGFTAESELRRTILVVPDLDIVPGDLASPARLECFQKCFLSSEPAGVRLCRRGTFGFAILTFERSEHTLYESRSSFDRFPYTVDFDYVGSYGQDHR